MKNIMIQSLFSSLLCRQVTDLMFKAYGDERYLCLPFVIAMNSPQDAEQAFDTLERYLTLTEPPPRPTLADCERGDLTLEEMTKMAQYGYNACINRIGGVYDLVSHPSLCKGSCGISQSFNSPLTPSSRKLLLEHLSHRYKDVPLSRVENGDHKSH